MQTYSAIKGKSKSDDGHSRFPTQALLERTTISDDGFESFPLYSGPAGRDPEADSNGESGEGDENFHSCDSEIQSYQDAENRRSNLGDQASPLASGNTNPLASRKKKRRRPKKRNRNSRGEGPATDKAEVGDGQDSSAVQKGGWYKGKGTVEGGEVMMKLAPEESAAAMEDSRLWQERSDRGM
jgi:hypothetical protein